MVLLNVSKCIQKEIDLKTSKVCSPKKYRKIWESFPKREGRGARRSSQSQPIDKIPKRAHSLGKIAKCSCFFGKHHFDKYITKERYVTCYKILNYSKTKGI